MGVFSKPESYAAQISLFIKNRDYAKAYDLSREMCGAFPDNMISRFLLAKCAFRLEKYEEAVSEGTKAFNLAKLRPDMVSCAVLLSTARFMLKQYDEGLRLLQLFEADNDEKVEEMLAIFSAATGDEKGTQKHLRALLKINRQSAEELIARFLEGYEGESSA